MMTMDASAGQAGAPPQRTEQGLKEVANEPGADPCDVCCDALPAHVVGDLTARDERWLHEHTSYCRYCANELHRYDRLDEALVAAGAIANDLLEPPPLKLPRRDRVWYTRMDSPIGELILAATPEGLREIDFASNLTDETFVERLRERGAEPIRLERVADADPAVRRILDRTAAELHEYFGGQRARFDVPLDWGVMPPFQRAVLEATTTVPFGRVDTYAGIARKIGKPGATRAVGNALGRNPIPVIVPCHRVIRSDATIGGYTGGLGIKQHLLSLEGIVLR